MAEHEDNRTVEVFPTLLHQSIHNAAMLEVLMIAMSELLGAQRGITQEEMLAKMRKTSGEIAKELLDSSVKG